MFIPRRRARTKSVRTLPTGLAILAALEIVAAIFLFIGAVALGLVSHLPGMSLLVGAFLSLGSVILIIICAVFLISAYGFVKGMHWGWWFGLVIGGISILSIAVGNLLGFVAGLIIIYYLTRPGVKKWFSVY